jgi:hypothetical protein
MNPTVKFAVARVQGLFYVVTGLWPIVHIGSFLFVTGPKTDLWLVQSFGALLVAVGCVMLLSTAEDRLGLTCKRLGIAVAAALAGADLVFALRGTIARIYLADAALELLFIVAWSAMMLADRAARRRYLIGSGIGGHIVTR